MDYRTEVPTGEKGSGRCQSRLRRVRADRRLAPLTFGDADAALRRVKPLLAVLMIMTALSAKAQAGPPCPQSTITVDVITDASPEQTSWEIRNQITNQLIAAEGPFDQPSTLLTFDVCVEAPGCYVFTFFDSAGNGVGPVLATRSSSTAPRSVAASATSDSRAAFPTSATTVPPERAACSMARASMSEPRASASVRTAPMKAVTSSVAKSAVRCHRPARAASRTAPAPMR